MRDVHTCLALPKVCVISLCRLSSGPGSPELTLLSPRGASEVVRSPLRGADTTGDAEAHIRRGHWHFVYCRVGAGGRKWQEPGLCRQIGNWQKE